MLLYNYPIGNKTRKKVSAMGNDTAAESELFKKTDSPVGDKTA